MKSTDDRSTQNPDFGLGTSKPPAQNAPSGHAFERKVSIPAKGEGDTGNEEEEDFDPDEIRK